MLSCLWPDHYSPRTYWLDRGHPFACPRGHSPIRFSGRQALSYKFRSGSREMGKWQVRHQLYWEARYKWYPSRSTNKHLWLPARQSRQRPTWSTKPNSEWDREIVGQNVYQWYAQADCRIGFPLKILFLSLRPPWNGKHSAQSYPCSAPTGYSPRGPNCDTPYWNFWIRECLYLESEWELTPVYLFAMWW